MRVGIATDHGGFGLKQELLVQLLEKRIAGWVITFEVLNLLAIVIQVAEAPQTEKESATQ